MGMPMLLCCVVAALVAGATLADVCDRSQRFLVSAGGAIHKAYVWPSKSVELHCRPSTEGDCRWLHENNKIASKSCNITTTLRGTITCMQIEENCGSIKLLNPPDKLISSIHQWGGYRNTYFDYTTTEARRNNYLCSDTGQLITKAAVCNGVSDCNNNEDELYCKSSCGRPHLPEHGVLLPDAELYPNGANVTYSCNRGLIFADTLGNVTRTCKRGYWSGAAPVCRRNLALHGSVHVHGGPSCNQTPVDGYINTWCLLPPSPTPQWLSVALTSIPVFESYRVLVRALQTQLRVSLQNANDSETTVSCSDHCVPQRAKAGYQQFSGLIVCDCPSSDKLSPSLSVVVAKKTTNALSQLSVAEVAVVNATPPAQLDSCSRLDEPAHGKYLPVYNSAQVRLRCLPGYEAICGSSHQVECDHLLSGRSQLRCESHVCLPPPTIPHAELVTANSTSFSYLAEAHYVCSPRYELLPPNQPTTAVCQAEGLWSLGHITCISEMDTRVVALKLSRQHQKSMDLLRSELSSGQLNMLKQLRETQWMMRDTRRRLVRLEKAAGLHAQLGKINLSNWHKEGSGESYDAVEDDGTPGEEGYGLAETSELSAVLATNLLTSPSIDDVEKMVNQTYVDSVTDLGHEGNIV